MISTNEFDRAMWDEVVREFGSDDARELLRIFLLDTTAKLGRIHRLEASSVRREAHSIKSSAATFGFRGLSDVARRLECGVDQGENTTLLVGLHASFKELSAFAKRELLCSMEDDR